MKQEESIVRTLAVAVAIALACSLMVSAAVYWLRPYKLAYAALERDRAVLVAAGLITPQASLSDREIVSRFVTLEARVIDLRNGQFTTDVDALTFDARKAAEDPAQSSPIAVERDLARLARRPYYAPVYVLRAAGRMERLVLPIYGRGMWSTLYGYIGLEADLSTVAGITFYEIGETPGIGDRIQDPAWTAQWRGKKLYDAEGRFRFALTSGQTEPDAEQFGVDAISGATITVTAVQALMRYWFGADGYGPFLALERAAAAPNP